MKLTRIRSLLASMTLLLAAAVSLTSCNDLIYDDEGDCSVHYRVRFRFTKNILNSDAFGAQVTEVNLFMFDKNGRTVYRKSQERAVTTDNDFFMEVDVPPGRYDMLAWCQGPAATPSAVSFGFDRNAETISALGATLPLSESDGSLRSDRDIIPLFHGLARNVEFPDSFGTIDIKPLDLIKDTNHLIVTLQNDGLETMDENIISITLEGANSYLDYLNQPVGDLRFLYGPWTMKGLHAEFPQEVKARQSVVQNGIMAELTTGRLLTGMEQMLTIRRTDTDETLLRIPLIKYLMLVRDEYTAAVSNQDYLDRCSEYSLVFFMQGGYTWMKTKVLINGWRVVPPQSEDL